MKPTLLGCIADDFTGATDLANNLVRAGMRVVQTIGVPDGALADDADAVVVALKSRTIPAARGGRAIARRAALAAGAAARARSTSSTARRSTARRAATSGRWPRRCWTRSRRRDFTHRDARRSRTTSARCSRATCSSATCCCTNSGMQQPSADADDRFEPRARAAGAVRRRKVGLDRLPRRRAAARRRSARASRELRAQGVRHRHRRRDLQRRPACAWAARSRDMPLVTAGSGVAIGAAAELRHRAVATRPARCRRRRACAAIVSGSCSRGDASGRSRTSSAAALPAFASRPAADRSGRRRRRRSARLGDAAAARTARCWCTRPPSPTAVHGGAAAPRRRRRRARWSRARWRHRARPGRARRAAARRRRRRDVGRVSCRRSASQQLRIGPQIDPGVPWCHAPADVGGAPRCTSR